MVMQSIRDGFEALYREWKEQVDSGSVSLSSSDDAYVAVPAFRAMVALDQAAIPFMIEKLRTDEDAHFLIHALAEITGERPPPPARADRAAEGPLGNRAQAAAWVAWWDERHAGDTEPAPPEDGP
jgi:hypothetical protein